MPPPTCAWRCAYQTQRQFSEAVAACYAASQRNSQSSVAQKRLQRINEEWALAKQAQAITTFQEALRRGVEQKDQEYVGLAIAYLWRAVELSTSRAQSIQCRTAPGAAYRARKDPLSLEQAAAQYELVLQHAPEHLAAMTGLAAVLRDLGELSQAKALYERVLAVALQDAHAQCGLAEVVHDQGIQQRHRCAFGRASYIAERAGRERVSTGPPGMRRARPMSKRLRPLAEPLPGHQHQGAAGPVTSFGQ
jgi:tetratricopeptide (TPR) repeat protein